jgi:hypothetical protein
LDGEEQQFLLKNNSPLFVQANFDW